MTAPETQTAQDSGSFAAFYAMMLHIDDDDLDPFEYKLLGHYRKICGLFKSETCTESVQTTADASKMSVAKVRDARKSLEEKGRIKVTGSDGRSLNVTVINCMAENLQRYSDNPYQKREGYQKREIRPIESGSSDLSNPIADLRIEESKEVNTNTSPQTPQPVPSANLKEGSETKKKSSAKRKNGSDPAAEVIPESYAAIIEAHHYSLPDDLRPSGKPSYARYRQLATDMANDGIMPYDVVRYMTLTYKTYREWAMSKGAPQRMSLNHVNGNIKNYLKVVNTLPSDFREQKAGVNGHSTPKTERTEAASTNGVGTGVLASNTLTPEQEHEYRQHLKRIAERKLPNVSGPAVDNPKRPG